MILRPFALAFAAGALIAGVALAAPAETPKPIFRQALPNIPGKSFTALRVDFAPGAKAASHRHGQAFVFAYVLSGEVRSQLAGEPPKVYRAGESWSEPPGAHHTMTENVSATEPASLLAVFVAESGAALKTNDPQLAAPMELAPP